jgi:hypothetical protein
MNMKYFNLTFLSTMALLGATTLFAQNPEYVDPGNVRDRNQDDSVYLWDHPEVFIPLVIVVVLIIAFIWLRTRNRSKRRRPD